MRSAGGLSLPTHGDPPGQKTGGLRISWPASVLTRTDAKEMPAARGTSYASDKFEQVRFRAVAAAREGCHLGDRRCRDHPPSSVPTVQAEDHLRRAHETERQHEDGQDHGRSEEHTSELQSRLHLVCRLLLEKK